MKIGASSSCFYPLETEKAFLNVAEMGIRDCEIFINSSSELKPQFLKELKNIKDSYGVCVAALHPYRSFSEGYDFFSDYKRRFYDAVESYKRYFEAAGQLGADYIIMHGAKGKFDISLEEYAERFGVLNEQALKQGVVVAHENVVNFSGAKPEFFSFMKSQLGDSFKMVLDIKQARRADANYEDFIKIMKSNIVHIHLSDFSEEKDCIAPSALGKFDFERLFALMHEADFKGRYIVELYSHSYSQKSEITESVLYLQNLLRKSVGGIDMNI